jgi:hypothetical protein
MQEITIKLWRKETADWTVEINGLRHEHVSEEIMEDLSTCALILAQGLLTEAASRRPM